MFGSFDSDAVGVLRAAVSGESGALGVVALLPYDAEDAAGEEEPPELVGAASGIPGDKPGELLLLTLVVRADARRRGLGRALLAALVEASAAHAAAKGESPPVCVVADVAAGNTTAWSFFEAAGFERAPTGLPGTRGAGCEVAQLWLQGRRAAAAAAGAAAGVQRRSNSLPARRGGVVHTRFAAAHAVPRALHLRAI